VTPPLHLPSHCESRRRRSLTPVYNCDSRCRRRGWAYGGNVTSEVAVKPPESVAGNPEAFVKLSS